MASQGTPQITALNQNIQLCNIFLNALQDTKTHILMPKIFSQVKSCPYVCEKQ